MTQQYQGFLYISKLPLGLNLFAFRSILFDLLSFCLLLLEENIALHQAKTNGNNRFLNELNKTPRMPLLLSSAKTIVTGNCVTLLF